MLISKKSIIKLFRRTNDRHYCNTRYFSGVIAANDRSIISNAVVSPSSPFCCYVHSGLSGGLMPYIRGHAWQTGLLHQMLSFPSHSSSLCDRLLIFEHDPVYTLGRGANEQHLLFLTKSKHDSCNDDKEEKMHKHLSSLLCRSNKSSPAHLSFSSNHTIQIKSSHDIPTDIDNDNNGKLLYEEKQHTEKQEENTLPIPTAPNGATIYRVERGGQVTYHGPGESSSRKLL